MRPHLTAEKRQPALRLKVRGLSLRERYVLINSPIQTDLLGIARQRLPPPTAAQAVPADVAGSRENFQQAIVHRPERCGGPTP